VPALLVSRGDVTTVSLNRPDVRNALDEALIAELTEFAERLPTDGSVRVVILRGEGPVFCAGADINWMSTLVDATRDENLADARRAARLFQALDALPVPLLGRVHGAALGGGAGLAALCDVVVADAAAVFGFSETTLGILPALIAPYVLARIGASAARELFLSGARFPADRARDVGLVHEVVPASDLDGAVEARVRQFRKTAPSAVAATKRLLREIGGRRPADVVALTVEALAAQRVAPEGQEGLRAFLEKRPPRWT
jgi:methylglutaconyl-CoA hydratase